MKLIAGTLAAVGQVWDIGVFSRTVDLPCARDALPCKACFA